MFIQAGNQKWWNGISTGACRSRHTSSSGTVTTPERKHEFHKALLACDLDGGIMQPMEK